MEKEEIGMILENQRKFFTSGKTLNIKVRLENLKKLRSLIIDHSQDIKDALWKDFHKPECEVISSELNFVLKELNLTIRKLKGWTRPKRVRTPIIHFIANSFIAPQPYGQVLILSPWNFPFQLSLVPVVGALSAGNCVILKTSQQVPNTAAIIEKIIGHFDKEIITVINGDHIISDYLLDYKFDYIFFTGSCNVGRYVMEKAAKNLIPVSLELGGKNPCVVASDARLDFAVKRIAWGKFYNAGQICISPDYVLIDKRIKDRFLELIFREIVKFYGEYPEQSADFARVINPSKAERLASLMKAGRIVAGGKTNPETCYVSPTVITDVKPSDPIMQEEIFGPVLPVIEYDNFEEIYEIIEQNPKPLASYIFSKNKKLIREFLSKTISGSSAVNDTVIQYATPFLPFGGVGCSGMGRYHGKKTFETFSNMRSVMVKSNLIDIFLRYPPYNKFKETVFKIIMR
jgi:aldehyde dehydrogenase (NAD+)